MRKFLLSLIFMFFISALIYAETPKMTSSYKQSGSTVGEPYVGISTAVMKYHPRSRNPHDNCPPRNDQPVTKVPEPATMILLGIGLIGVSALTKKKDHRDF
jgi:hypothetical protein